MLLPSTFTAVAASPSNPFAFVSPFDASGHISTANIGKDVVLSDVYGLPAAFAYLAWRYTREGSLSNAWPPSRPATALWIAAVALAAAVVPDLL